MTTTLVTEPSLPHAVRFFEQQFQRQLDEGELPLNPFEQLALPYLSGAVLDYGCGLGSLALAAARRGCRVQALDASPTAVAHLQTVARTEGLALQAFQADLRTYEPADRYDAIACIGLLMFFDCAALRHQLHVLQRCVRPGGVLVLNLLIEGTTFLDMFDPHEHCLLARSELLALLTGWELLHCDWQDYPAPRGLRKSFGTLVVRKPV